jgi:hypothetical protein
LDVTWTKPKYCTYGDSNVSDNPVTFGEILDILSQLNYSSNGFMSGDELERVFNPERPKPENRLSQETGR